MDETPSKQPPPLEEHTCSSENTMGTCSSKKDSDAMLTMPTAAARDRPPARRSSGASVEEKHAAEMEALTSYVDRVSRTSKKPQLTSESTLGSPKGNEPARRTSPRRSFDNDLDVSLSFVQERVAAKNASSAVKRPAEAASIGLDIIESGRASVRRTSINSLASPPPEARVSHASGDNDAAVRREARRARFAVAIEGDGADSTPAQSGGATAVTAQSTSHAGSGPSTDMVTSLVAARRSARRSSVAAPTVAPAQEPVSKATGETREEAPAKKEPL